MYAVKEKDSFDDFYLYQECGTPIDENTVDTRNYSGLMFSGLYLNKLESVKEQNSLIKRLLMRQIL